MSIRFGFPVHNVILTNKAGTACNEGLLINVKLNERPDRHIEVNGVICKAGENDLRADVLLTDYKNTIIARDTQTGEEEKITVYYLNRQNPTFRFSLDDNIWFLQNINNNRDVYKSIFEDPYLKLLKTMNDKYKTKFHLNIYYECPENGGFNLSQMTDKYKNEWVKNSDWLRLSFHANADLPDKPYIDSDYNKIYFEHKTVTDEIKRFAGEETFAGPVTTVHWGEATKEAVRALRDQGIRVLIGSFKNHAANNAHIGYYLTAEQCSILNTYGAYYDEEMDMIFLQYTSCNLQHNPVEQMKTRYDFQFQDTIFGHWEICLHEQYFYSDYKNYQPNYYEKFDTVISWCMEHGFESVFVSELFDLTSCKIS